MTTKKNEDKNAKKVNLVNKAKTVDPKQKANKTVVDTKKYKTKEEISRLSTVAIIKYAIKNRTGKKYNQLHGCYCGPGHGDTKNGPKPKDYLDRLCRAHDKAYEKYGYFSRKANNEFIAGVDKYAPLMTPAEREKAYYFAEGFKRMNKTPLQEIAKVGSIISAPFRAVGNLITGGVKAVGSLFNKNTNVAAVTATGRSLDMRSDNRNNGKLLLLKKNQPRRAR